MSQSSSLPSDQKSGNQKSGDHKPVGRDPRWYVGLGLLAGVLSGLFGVGGGFIVVPLLMRLGLPTRRAAATSLAAVIPIACAALVPYWFNDQVHGGVGLLLFAGSMAGTLLGTNLLRKVPVRVIQYLFVGILLLAAARLAISVAAGEQRPLTWQIDVGLALLGVATGLLSGLLGVGGGFIMVPGMMFIASMPSNLAKGTSLAAIIPSALVGSWRNYRGGLVDLSAATRVGLAGAVASAASATLAVRINQRVSNAAFAAMLLVLAVSMLLTARKGEPDQTNVADTADGAFVGPGAPDDPNPR